MNNKSPQEIRGEVRDRFAGLTGTYDGADAMADYVVEMLTSHMQAGFEYVIGDIEKQPDKRARNADMRRNGRNQLRAHQRQRASEWMEGK